jgi:hypothetical protein
VVGGIAIVPNLGGHADHSTQVAAGGSLPSTGRDANVLFREAWGKQEGDVKSGGAGAGLGATFATALGGDQPEFLDSAWQPGPGGHGRAEWALLTWVKDGKAAEGLLVANDSPIYTAVYPAPYTVCGTVDKDSGRTCDVREMAGKGWLKIVSSGSGKDAKLNASLQRVDGKKLGRMYGFSVSGGAITKAGLAAGRSPLGSLPATGTAISDALLALP